MTEVASSVPDFTLGEVTFRCFAVTDDDGTSSYKWRSLCGRYSVWRSGAKCVALNDGKIVGRSYASLGKAMVAAMHFNDMEQAA